MSFSLCSAAASAARRGRCRSAPVTTMGELAWWSRADPPRGRYRVMMLRDSTTVASDARRWSPATGRSVVRGHVHGLDRGDRTGLGQVMRSRSMPIPRPASAGSPPPTAYGRAARTLRYRPGVTVDAVDEQQHVAAIAEELAMVRPVSATRRRLPAARSSGRTAPPCRERWSPSFHDRSRSFTGTLADAREHRVTAVLDGDVADRSIMLTVLPTLTPEPISPPLAKGHSRSMTLMPVSSSSVLPTVLRSSAPCGESGSAGLRRPDAFVYGLAEHVHDAAGVLIPTGTEIGAPVLLTTLPRVRPAEAPWLARTMPSPSCCCTQVRSTSSTSSASWFWHFPTRELRDDGADDLYDFS